MTKDEFLSIIKNNINEPSSKTYDVCRNVKCTHCLEFTGHECGMFNENSNMRPSEFLKMILEKEIIKENLERW